MSSVLMKSLIVVSSWRQPQWLWHWLALPGCILTYASLPSADHPTFRTCKRRQPHAEAQPADPPTREPAGVSYDASLEDLVGPTPPGPLAPWEEEPCSLGPQRLPDPDDDRRRGGHHAGGGGHRRVDERHGRRRDHRDLSHPGVSW